MKVEVYIEGQRLDLYNDEQINVKSSAQDINDISKLFTDFSQSFTVPASDNNNNIFNLYYNPDIDNGYDARLRKDSVIYINTLDFKRGKMRLDSVSIKNGVAQDYRITFFGSTIKIKDLIGDDKFKDLDWLDNFNHDFNETNVKTGLTTGLDFTVGGTTYTKGIVYPLISYNRQYFYSSDSSDTTATDVLCNIAYDSGRTDGIYYRDLKPAINLPVVIEAIEQKYGFNFSGSFFTSPKFTEMYMNLNKDTDRIVLNNLRIEDIQSGVFANSAIVVEYEVLIEPKAGFGAVEYGVKVVFNGEILNDPSIVSTGDKLRGGVKLIETVIPAGTTYDAYIEVFSDFDFEFDATTELEVITQSGAIAVEFTNTYSSQVIDDEVRVTNIVPDLKVFDFLTSLIKMFNLVARPDADDIYIEDLITWYANGNIYDVTPYIDTTKHKVSRGKIHSEINFNFEETDQILSDQYRQSNDQGYGDLEYSLKDGLDQRLNDVDGDVLDIEVIFENPMYERLFDTNTSLVTTIQYCLFTDGDIKSIVGKPFLMYCPAVNVSSNTVGYKGVSAYSEISTNLIMPSHSKLIASDSFNLNFGSVFNEYTGEVYSDTIFNSYWSDYIVDMFSIRRRLFDFDAILPDELLNKLKLNDRLIINDRRYIINNISSNLVTRKDTLELINDIYDAPLASDTLTTSQITPAAKTYSGIAQSDSFTYFGVIGGTISKADTGDGTSWITGLAASTDATVDEITFSIDKNSLGVNRGAKIKITDGLNDPEFTITQEPDSITFDNTVIKFDQDTITWDAT